MASGLLHGGLVVVLASAIAPDPPPDGQTPEAEFDISSYQVPHSTAPEEQADATALSEDATNGTRTRGQAVPQSRAAPVPLTGQRAAPLAAPPAIAATAPLGADRPAVAPPAPAIAPVTTPADRVASLPQEALLAPPLQSLAASAPITATTPIVADRLRQAPAAPTLAPVTTPAERVASLPQAAPLASPVQPLAPVAASAPAVAERPPDVPSAPRIASVPASAERVTSLGQGAVSVSPLPSLTTLAPMTKTIAAVADRPPELPPAPKVAAFAAARPPALRLQTGQGALVAAAPPVVASAAITARVVPAALSRAAPLPTAHLPDAAPISAALAGQRPESALQVSEPAPAARFAALATPAAPLGESAPSTVDLLGSPAVGGDLPAATPDVPVAAAIATEGARQTAALAWSGGGDAALNDVSLAAIQAFSRAGDPSGDGPKVRDAIGALLAQVPCARLQTVFDPDSGQLELRGHIPDNGLRAPVLAALGAQVGPSIPLTDNLLILPRPQCGALAGIAAVGLAQSDEQEGDPRVVGDQPFAAVSRFAEGDLLTFEVKGPDYPAFVYVDYFDADGQVLHLQPNDLVPLRQIAPKERMVIGQRADGAPAMKLIVSPPFGQEIMVTFASSEPLYDGMRPTVEPAAPYLDFLKSAVAGARARSADFQGEWFYFFVSTGPKS